HAEMPPTAVQRHVKVRKAPARDPDDPLDHIVEPLGSQSEMPGLPALRRGKDDRAALAHRRRAEQVVGQISVRTAAQSLTVTPAKAGVQEKRQSGCPRFPLSRE